MSGICWSTGPLLGAEGPQVVMFTVLSAEKGAILEAGKAGEAFACETIIPRPPERAPTSALGPECGGHW